MAAHHVLELLDEVGNCLGLVLAVPEGFVLAHPPYENICLLRGFLHYN